MPELAEVETVRRQIAKRLTGRRVKEVVLNSTTPDPYLFAFVSSGEVVGALTGAKIQGTGRKGKYFWLELDRKPWPIFHLGMSGNIALLDLESNQGSSIHESVWEGAKLWTRRDKDLEKRLKFSRLTLNISDGFELAFTDPRRFGRIWLSSNPSTHPRILGLGYDPLLDFPTAEILQGHLRKRKMAIKSVLLDQSLFAGIGNWLADEILYHAQISPHQVASLMELDRVELLRQKILLVIHKAVEVSVDYERFPKDWLFHHRWRENKQAVTSRGQKVIREAIGGRTSAWVVDWQS